MFWRITWQMATLWSFLRPLRYYNLCVCVKVLSFRIESNRIDKNCQRIAWLFRTSHYHIVKTVFYMLCRFCVSLSTLQQLPLYGVSMLWRAERNERAYVYAKGAVCMRERERKWEVGHPFKRKRNILYLILKTPGSNKSFKAKFTSHLYQDT